MIRDEREGKQKNNKEHFIHIGPKLEAAREFGFREFLLAKLKWSGIDGAVLNWIKSLRSNRSNQVQINGVLSEEAPCLSGVPQGSVIGPLPFLLYINDLPAALGDSAFLFADDVKMMFPQS